MLLYSPLRKLVVKSSASGKNESETGLASACLCALCKSTQLPALSGEVSFVGGGIGDGGLLAHGSRVVQNGSVGAVNDEGAVVLLIGCVLRGVLMSKCRVLADGVTVWLLWA